MQLKKARAAKATAARRLAHVEGINGLGLSRRGDHYALKVNFESKPRVEIPNYINGVEVIVEVVGKIRKRQQEVARPTFHVIPHNGRWAIRRIGRQRVSSVHGTQQEAVAVARARARKARGVLVIHARDGSIRDRDSYATVP